METFSLRRRLFKNVWKESAVHRFTETGRLSIVKTSFEPEPVVASDSVTWLTEVEPDVVVSPSAPTRDLLHVLRCLSAPHGCKQCSSVPSNISLNYRKYSGKSPHQDKDPLCILDPFTAENVNRRMLRISSQSFAKTQNVWKRSIFISVDDVHRKRYMSLPINI